MPGIGSNNVSAALGVTVLGAGKGTAGGYLPQRIGVFGEANHANQSADNFTTPTQVTSARQVAEKYGYGSPLHLMALELLPPTGGGTTADVWIYAQAAASGAVAQVTTVGATGTATGSGRQFVRIAGVTGIDGQSYGYDVVTGDTAAVVLGKMVDAVNAAVSAPCTAVIGSPAADFTLTTKWKGATANKMVVQVDTNGLDLGITYTVNSTTSGSGTPSITASLAMLGDDWVTIIVNGYGTESTVLDSFESINGKPDLTNPTGRWHPEVGKPFIAITGSTADDPSSSTSARKNNLTIAIAPAPYSDCFDFQAAANMAVLFGNISNDAPHTDVLNLTYPNVPGPRIGRVPLMQDYRERDRIVKLGCSTALAKDGQYVLKDFVTTYRPDGENPPRWRFCRTVMIDMNVIYAMRNMMEANIWGYALVNDGETPDVDKYITPKMAKGLALGVIDTLVDKALLTDKEYSRKNATAYINESNPDRLELEIPYKSSGLGRIVNGVYRAKFNFGGSRG